MKLKTFYILAAVFLFSLALHLYKLGSNPSTLNRDEAALGYNAYLLEKTGLDEWGIYWPLTLKSFGDYKLIGYPAILTGLFQVFTPADWVVRLPSAVAGAGVIVLLYGLYLRVGNDKRVALFVSILAATTPIFFFYSRIAFEANVGLLFFLTAVFFFLRPLDRKTTWFDLIAVVCVVISVITYNTPLLLLPFIIFLLPFWRGTRNYAKWLPVCTAAFLVFIIFLKIFTSLTAQKEGITIFADETTTLQYGAYRASFPWLLQRILGNKYIYYLSIMGKHFFESFSPTFLVIRGGGHPWHQLPGWSHLVWPEYLLALGGISVCIFTSIRKKNRQLWRQLVVEPLQNSSLGKSLSLLYLLIISLVPASITVDAPHATRSLFFIVVVLLCFGVLFVFTPVKAVWKKIVMILTITLVFSFFGVYLYQYWTVYPQEQVALLQPGFAAIVQKLEREEPFTPVAVVDSSGYQYILLAWYLKTEPNLFFQTIRKQQPDQIGFRYGEQVTHYHFIAKTSDRSQAEKFVVEWKDNQWQLFSY